MSHALFDSYINKNSGILHIRMSSCLLRLHPAQQLALADGIGTVKGREGGVVDGELGLEERRGGEVLQAADGVTLWQDYVRMR